MTLLPSVRAVQNPTLSLTSDAAAARLIIDAKDGPVGHSALGLVTLVAW